MKMFALMLSVILSTNAFAAVGSDRYMKSRKPQAQKNSKKNMRGAQRAKSATQVKRASQTAYVAPAIARQLPAKKANESAYSAYYPFTETTSAARGSLKMTESRDQVIVPTIKDEPKKWFIKFDSENMQNITEENPGGYNGDVFAVQTLSYGYKFTDMSTIQISQDWSSLYGYGTTSDGKQNAHSNSLEDLNFRYTYSSLYKTEKSNLTGQIRYYAPSSENSQLAGQIGQIRLYGIWTYTLAPSWSTTWMVSPRYFMQTAEAYEDYEGKVKNNNQWRLLNSLGLRYDVTDFFALETTVGVYSKKKYNEHMRHFQDYSSSFYLNIGPHIGFQIGLRASDGAYDTRDKGGFNFYDPDYSEYFGILTLRI